jgi:hypothetical protein
MVGDCHIVEQDSGQSVKYVHFCITAPKEDILPELREDIGMAYSVPGLDGAVGNRENLPERQQRIRENIRYVNGGIRISNAAVYPVALKLFDMSGRMVDKVVVRSPNQLIPLGRYGSQVIALSIGEKRISLSYAIR